MLVAKDAKHFVNVREGTDDLYVSIDSVGVGSLGRYGQPTARPWNYCDRPIDQAFTVFFCLVPGLTAIACGLVLALRRFEGALDAPARPLTILSVGMCGVLIILASDAATWLIGHGFLFGRVTSRIGFLLAIWAMALPGVNGIAIGTILAVAFTTIVLPNLIALRTYFPHRIAPSRFPVSRFPQAPLFDHQTMPEKSSTSFRSSTEQPSFDAVSDMRIRQWFQRGDSPEGADILTGTLTLHVLQGTRVAWGHIGFCPSFAHTPTLSVSTSFDGTEALVQAAEVLPWGARIECRLDDPAEENFYLPIDLVAKYVPPLRSADESDGSHFIGLSKGPSGPPLF